MDLVTDQYIEISLIGIAILLVMLFYMRKMHPGSRSSSGSLFIRMLVSNVFILASDCGILLLQDHTAYGYIVLNYIMCCTYFVLHFYFAYLWLRYCMKKIWPEYQISKQKIFLYLIPCNVGILLSLLSPWTGLFFSVTSENYYQRGPLLNFDVCITYSYWIVSSVLMIREILKKDKIIDESLYKTLLFFPIPTVVGNLLQLRFYGLTIAWICSAISLLVLFINLQHSQLSHDILTRLYNRRQMDTQIGWELRHLPTADYLFFVIIIDVDDFKGINDKFGHLSGDSALLDLSTILRKSCGDKDFIGRFGGDEFIIMGHVYHESEVKDLIDRINQNIENFNQSKVSPYQFSISLGVGMYSKNSDDLTMDSVISIADRAMYQVKNSKK